MKMSLPYGSSVIPLAAVSVALCCLLISGASTGAQPAGGGSIPLTVPKATCGPNDHPETALQGQVPTSLRTYVAGDPTKPGFQGFNCNLELIGQSKGDGANWQTTEFRNGNARVCGYHGTAFSTV